MGTPIACTLDQAAARSQMAQWRDFLAGSVTSVERVTPTELVFGLAETAEIAALVRLAQLEKACCAFFDFALLIEADRLVLRLAVPNEATAILDAFTALAG